MGYGGRRRVSDERLEFFSKLLLLFGFLIVSGADKPSMVVTLGQLASVPSMPSEPTLRKLIDENPDFPLLSRGRNGVAYEMDLAAAISFIKGLEAKKEEERRASADQVKQLGLALLGEDAASDLAQAALSATERKAMLEGELFAIRVGRERGELVRKASMEAAVGAVFQLLNSKMRSLPARLSKRMELSRKQIALIDQIVERDLTELADKFEEMGRTGDGATDASGDPAV